MSNIQVKGFVKRVGRKDSPPNSRRKWTLWSLLIVDETGKDAPGWVSLGFRDEAPKVSEGDYIKLEAEKDERNNLVAIEGTTKRVSNPPARQAPPSESGGRGGGNGGGRSYSGNKFDGTGISNRTNPEDAKRMTYSAARSAAIEVITLLLDNDGLPIAAAKGKAGEATRFEQIKAAIDKLTVEFYNDGLSLRKLETVADAGVVNVKPDGDLPPEKVGHEIDDDDAPPDAEVGEDDDESI